MRMTVLQRNGTGTPRLSIHLWHNRDGSRLTSFFAAALLPFSRETSASAGLSARRGLAAKRQSRSMLVSVALVAVALEQRMVLVALGVNVRDQIEDLVLRQLVDQSLRH